MAKKVYDINFEKLPTQAKVYDDDLTKTIVMSCGLGSGKTYNLCMKCLKLSWLNRDRAAGGILAPSLPDFKRDILPTMEDILEERGIPYIYRDSGKKGRYFLFPWSKKPVYVFSAERPIAGPNLGFCLINEFSLIPYKRINEMMRRVRVKNAPALQKILVGTPEDVHGWLEEFIEDQEKIEKVKPGTFKIHFGGSEENIHIDEDYALFLEQTLDEDSLEIFKNGQIGRIGGEFFYYAFKQDKNVDDSIEFSEDEHVWAGVDFNVGKMAVTFSHKYGDEQHFFDEKMVKGNDADTQELANFIVDKFGIDFIRAGKLTVICDASGKNRKTIADKNGLRTDVAILRKTLGHDNVKFKAANPRLRKRQLQQASMMSHGKIRANSRCKGLILDWKKTKQNPDYTKSEGKEGKFSHFSDGGDYVVDFIHDFDLSNGRKSSSRQL